MESFSFKSQRWFRRIVSPTARLMLVVCAVLLARIPVLSLRGRLIADAEPIASIVEKLLFLAVAIAIWWTISVFVERRPLTETGFGKKRRLLEFGVGVVLGTGLISSLVGVYAIAGWYRVSSSGFDRSAIASAVLVLSVTALFEEFLFRALLFRFVEQLAGSWGAITLIAFLFAGAHLQNPSSTWTSTLALAFAGAVFCLAFIATRSIWLVTGLHIGWNVSEAVVFGLPVSGVQLPSLVVSHLTGPDLWTGGSFGPEASAACAIISLATGLCLVIFATKRNTVINADGQDATFKITEQNNVTA